MYPLLDGLQMDRDSLIRRAERVADRLSNLELQGTTSSDYYKSLDNEYQNIESQLSKIEIRIRELSHARH